MIMIDHDDCNNQDVDDTYHHQAGNNRSSSGCTWPLPPPTQPPTLDLLSNTTRLNTQNHQGWPPRPAGRGGLPAPPRTAGKGGFPAPPRKNDQNCGEVAGQNKGPNFNFLQQQNNITTLNKAQSSLSIRYARESKKWKYLLLFLLTGHQTLFMKIFNLWNSSSMSKILSLVLLMMMAIMLVMMLMIIMMVMLIVITIKIMNVE